MYLDLLTILLLLGTLAPVSVFATPADPEPSVYMITTRGNLQSPVGLDGSGYHNLYQFQPISSLFQSCPSEIVIFIHGGGVGSEASKEQLDRVKMSLENSSYHFPLIGYSWGSDIDWNDAKILSIQEGAKLAHFISTYNQMCNSDDIISQVRLIGHSLGARVILSSLHNLSSQSSDNFNLLSVHLMGAAVDNEEVSMDPIDPYSNPSPWWWVAGCTVDTTGVKKAYGDAIQQKVINFYNLVNSRDNVLEFIYPCYEGGDRALGQDGKQDSPLINTPSNYYDIDESSIESELSPINDADGIAGCDLGICNLGLYPAQLGDNYLGYMGFRLPANPNILASDGVMNLIVDHWRAERN